MDSAAWCNDDTRETGSSPDGATYVRFLNDDVADDAVETVDETMVR